MRWFILALLTVCAHATPQYVKTAGVKGGYNRGYQYQAGESHSSNTTSQHGYGYGGYSGPRINPAVNFDRGVCYIEVPTASLVQDPTHIPAGNGSRPDLSRIRSCCRGYTRNVYNYLICEPVCSNTCVNGLCVAPETCSCYPDHVKNLEGQCIATCPIGCQNGQCSGGECVCNSGYKLDSESKYCIPICRDDCGGIYSGKCVAPNRCECKQGYTSSPDGSCKPDCGRCVNGECVGPAECRCLPGYAKNHASECEPQCVNTCRPPSHCIAPNVCSNTLTTTTTAPYYQHIPNTNGISPSPPTSDSQYKPNYPGSQNPNNPGNLQPNYPGNQQPGLPGQQPGSQQPGYPGQQSVYPGSQQPGYPGQQSVYPGSQQPGYPGQQPIHPGSQQPGHPGQQPFHPGSQQPGYPGQQQSNYPGQQQSNYPGSQQPTNPGHQEHTYPGSNLPGLSGYQQPNGPSGQQPGYPTSQYYPGSHHPDHQRPNSPSNPHSSQSPTDRQPYYPNSQYYPGSQHPDPQHPNYPNQPSSYQLPKDREPYYPNSQYYPGQSNYQPHSPGSYPYPTQSPTSESQHRYPDSQSAFVDVACSQPCVNGTCVGRDRCACNTGYLPIDSDTSRCQPFCPSCSNGTCVSPYVCVCDPGFYKDFSVKGRSRCIPRRIRRSANTDTSEPLNIAQLLTYEIPDYEN